MTVRVDNPAPAQYDLGQLRALAVARFGAALLDCNTVAAADGSTLVAVYLPDLPTAAAASSWQADLAGYTLTHPTGAEMSANQAALITRAQAALATNAAFLGIGAPSNAQVLAQVQTLTRECSAVIRLLLGQFDATAGT